jgi:hydrogenase/urease accessory protein HupE
VLGDVVSFFAQGSGGGLQAGKNFNKKTAKYIILAGLAVQILGFGLFAVTALVWHVRMHAAKSLINSRGKWEKIMAMLYAVSVLIMVRSIFRVVEYVMGTDGYLLRHEWPLYVFDALLMMLTVGVFAWWYPGQLSYSLVATKEEADSNSDMA